jgi:hypothetical protein
MDNKKGLNISHETFYKNRLLIFEIPHNFAENSVTILTRYRLLYRENSCSIQSSTDRNTIILIVIKKG